MASVDVLKLSLKDIKAELDAMRASLVGLDKESEEYKKGVEDIVKAQSSLDQVLRDTRGQVNGLEGSYNALQQEMAALRKEWKATNDEGRRNELGQQINAINEQLKSFDATIGNHQRSVGNYAIAGESMRSVIMQTREEIAQLLAQGLQPTDERIQALVASAGNMRDALDDANAIINQTASDTSKLDTALDMFKAGTAAVGLFQSAMAGLGVEEGTSVEIIKKLQISMTALNSLSVIQTALFDKQSKTFQFLNSLYLKLFATKKVTNTATQAEVVTQGQLATASNAAATSIGAQSAANTTLATTTNVATGSLMAFRAALMATGIGALVVGLGMLISYLTEVSGIFKSSASEAEEYANAIERAREAVESLASGRREVAKGLLDAGMISEEEEALMEYSIALEEFKRGLEGTRNEVDLGNASIAAYTEQTASMINEMARGSNTDEERRRTLKSLGNQFAQNEKRVKAIEEALNDEKKAEKEFGKEAVKNMKALLPYLKQAQSEYRKLQAVLSAKHKIDKINEEQTKKDAEATEKAAQAAERAAERQRREAERRQKEAKKIADTEIKSLQNEGAELKSLIDYEYELRKARGITYANDTYERRIKELKAEKENLLEQRGLYMELAKREDLSADARAQYNVELDKTNKLLEENKRKMDVAIESEATASANAQNQLERTYIDAFNELVAMSESFRDKQLEVGLVPVLDPIDTTSLKKSVQYNAEGDFPLYIKLDFSHNDDAASQIEMFLGEIRESTERGMQESAKDFGIDTMAEDWMEQYNAIIKSMENRETTFGQDIINKRRDVAEESVMLEISRAQRSFDVAHQSIIDRMQQNREEVKQTAEGTEERKKLDDEYYRLRISRETLITNTYIKLKELEQQKDDEVTEKRKRNLKEYLDASIQSTKALGSLMGSIASAKEEGIKQDLANDKISQERADEEFERVKQIELAELWINTLAGAAGAFLQDMQSYPWPFNAVIAGLDFGTAMAMGIAQTRQIKQQTIDSSGGGGSSSPSVGSVGVSPLLNETLDPQLMSQLNTQEAIQDQKVYILQSELEQSGRQVEIRESDTSF